MTRFDEVEVGCPCGHKLEFCHKVSVERWCRGSVTADGPPGFVRDALYMTVQADLQKMRKSQSTMLDEIIKRGDTIRQLGDSIRQLEALIKRQQARNNLLESALMLYAPHILADIRAELVEASTTNADH